MHVLLPILDEEIFPEITITIPPLEAEIGRKNRTAGNAGHHADIIDQASTDNRLIHHLLDQVPIISWIRYKLVAIVNRLQG